MRKHSLTRKTKETDITVKISLDGRGENNIKTGIGFLDHMLEQLSKHSMIDIDLSASGDLHIDYHHTTEDSALALGEAFSKSLGDRRGIFRQGLKAVAKIPQVAETVLPCRGYIVLKLNRNTAAAAVVGHGKTGVHTRGRRNVNREGKGG